MEKILKEMGEIKDKDIQDVDDIMKSLDLLGEALDIDAEIQQKQLREAYSAGYLTGAFVTAGMVIIGAILASKK